MAVFQEGRIQKINPDKHFLNKNTGISVSKKLFDCKLREGFLKQAQDKFCVNPFCVYKKIEV